MLLASISVHNMYSRLEKKKGVYTRTTQAGPGDKKRVLVVSELEAATLCQYSDWELHDDRLETARAERFPYQAILYELTYNI